MTVLWLAPTLFSNIRLGDDMTESNKHTSLLLYGINYVFKKVNSGRKLKRMNKEC
jgi:hypothetical protein